MIVSKNAELSIFIHLGGALQSDANYSKLGITNVHLVRMKRGCCKQKSQSSHHFSLLV